MTKINRTNKGFVPNLQKLPLTEYFASLPKADRRPVIISAPKRELVESLAALCGKDQHTVRRWLYGYTKPCKAEKDIIADYLKTPVDVLFPQNEEISA